MGAVSIQLYLQDMALQPSQPFLQIERLSCVLDSSFASFRQMIYQYSARQAKLSRGWEGVLKTAMNGVLRVESRIERQLGFPLTELDILRHAHRYLTLACLDKVVFVASQGDTLLRPESNSQLLYDSMLYHTRDVQVSLLSLDPILGGDHNQMREASTLQDIISMMLSSPKHFHLQNNRSLRKRGDECPVPEEDRVSHRPSLFSTTRISLAKKTK